MFKPVFVDDLKAHLRRHSVRILALLAAIQPAWVTLDESIKGGIPLWLSATVNTLLAIGGIYGALQKQDIGLQAFAPPEKEPGE